MVTLILARPPSEEVRAFISDEVDVVPFFQALHSAGLRARLDRDRNALVIERDKNCQEIGQEFRHG